MKKRILIEYLKWILAELTWNTDPERFCTENFEFGFPLILNQYIKTKFKNPFRFDSTDKFPIYSKVSFN